MESGTTTTAPAAAPKKVSKKTATGKSTTKAAAGKTAGKRHQNQPRLSGNIAGITNPALRRIARRGGVKRLNGNVYDEARNQLQSFLTTVVNDSVTYTKHGSRKTVTSDDVCHSLQRNGFAMYGCGN
jgi:histone H4